MSKINHNCPLCNSPSSIFYKYKDRIYHQCKNCSGVFVDRSLILDQESEKLRYQSHNNNVNDIGYQQFVKPLTDAVLRNQSDSDIGLDFGAGTGPVVSKILINNDYQINQYDPFFHDNPKLLQYKYDYIVCCEVIEHFNNPHQEFVLLRKMLLPNGRLYCMTNIYDVLIDFHNWDYKNDKTHVFIYHEKSLNWIKQEFSFSDLKISGRLIIFAD